MSAFYLNRYSFHDVQLEGRRVLFHIPSSGLFELDELGGSLIDFLKENEKITLYAEILQKNPQFFKKHLSTRSVPL